MYGPGSMICFETTGGVTGATGTAGFGAGLVVGFVVGLGAGAAGVVGDAGVVAGGVSSGAGSAGAGSAGLGRLRPGPGGVAGAGSSIAA